MISFKCLYINKPQILASTVPNNTSPQLPHHHNASSKPPNPTINIAKPIISPSAQPRLQQQRLKQKQKQKPSIMEIERAIGAGTFRDRDGDSDSGENKTLFDSIFLKTVGKTEGTVEKQLRETGEWVSGRTETTLRSAGKPILLFVFQWILPIWIFAFLLASGIIKVPFNSSLLDDLIL